MLFSLSWQFTDQSEPGERRTLALFEKWAPPEGWEFKGFYGYADGSGGTAIIEVDSAQTLARGTAVWTPWLTFEAQAIVDIQESAAISGEAAAWRDAN